MSPTKKKGLGRGLSALFGDETEKTTIKDDRINSITKEILFPDLLFDIVWPLSSPLMGRI